MSVDVIKQELLSKLKQEHCFWSYNEDSIKDIPDDMLIEKTLLHLDLEEINQSFFGLSFQENQAGMAGLSHSTRGISLYVEPFFCMVLF